MTKSDSIKELAAALRKFQHEVGAIPKNGTNPFYKSKYATLENVLETIKEPLFNNNFSFAQFPSQTGLVTILMHTSGEWIQEEAPLFMKDQSPQGQGSALSYMRRYALSGILGLATEDDDAEATKPPKTTLKPSINVVKEQPWKKPVTSTDDQRKVIKQLIDSKVLNPLYSKEEYENYVFDNFDLQLSPENYVEIIDALNEK